MEDLTIVTTDMKSPKELNKPETFGFNRRLFYRFYLIHKIIFKRLFSFSTLFYVLLMLACILEEYITYYVGLIASKFYGVLPTKDKDGFYKVAVNSLLLIMALASIRSMKILLANNLTIEWRKLISNELHKYYFLNSKYYQLNAVSKSIDNPDQRITKEVEEFTSEYGQVLPDLLVSPFVIGYYTYKNYNVTGWQGTLAIYGFFIVTTFINKLIMTPITKMTVKLNASEGDYRFIHSLVRSNAESIAFHDADQNISKGVNNYLKITTKNQKRLYIRHFFLNWMVALTLSIGVIFCFVLIAIPIFSGKYDSEPNLVVLISEYSFQALYLIKSFSNIISALITLTKIAGVAHRISQLLEKMKIFEPDIDKPQNIITMKHLCNNENRDNVKPAWIFTNVSYKSPQSDNYLIKNLFLIINLGEPIMIMGPSSSGKTSFLRVLRGLWKYEGGIECFLEPGPSGAYYLPQIPVLTNGTLREQISFPSDPIEANLEENKRIWKYIKLLQLEHIVSRFGGLDRFVSFQMYGNLSPGEAQRIAFLRLFYHNPLVAVLDEATSAIPEDMEGIIYEELCKLKITTISVGHRSTLRKFHKRLIKFDLVERGIIEIIDI